MNFVPKRMRIIWNERFIQNTSKDTGAKIDAKDDTLAPAQIAKQIIIMIKCLKKKKTKEMKEQCCKQMGNIENK